MNKFITPMEYDSLYGLFMGVVLTHYYYKYVHRYVKAIDLVGFFKGML